MRIENSNVILSTNTARLSYNNSRGFSEIYSQIKESFSPSSAQGQHNAPIGELNFNFSPALRSTRIVVTEVESFESINKEDQALDLEIEQQDDRTLSLLQKLLEKLTGKKVKFHLKGEPQFMNKIYSFVVSSPDMHSLLHSNPVTIENPEQSHDSVPFKSEGLIKTSDGRVIDFSLVSDLNSGSVTLNVPNEGNSIPVDPLVVNFASAAAGLTNVKFNFDLDSDGKLESISFPSPGSGFLALDKNNDGIISSGSELFGPSNGDGFSELAKYDTDSNNWIDENDEVFSNLKIWSKDSDGNDALGSAVANGIGAIFLGSVPTNVNLTGNNGENPGQVAQTGVFLHENGTVGTIQHVNLNL